MQKTIVIGGGMIGSLFSIILKRKGYDVQVYERRPNLLKDLGEGGHSTSLLLTEKGLNALNLINLKEKVIRETVPVFGQMIHPLMGSSIYQSYGIMGNECHYSISKIKLNKMLVSCALNEGVHFNFNQQLCEIDLQKNIFKFQNGKTAEFTNATSAQVFAADGSKSTCRDLMAKSQLVKENITSNGFKYKEFVIPITKAEELNLKQNTLHIWPRGNHILVALPNLDGSLTANLYLPEVGELSFENLKEEKNIHAYFKTFYPNLNLAIPVFIEDYLRNPVIKMTTVQCTPWHFQDKLALIGDAAHGILPVFGQGMNAGFDDCALIDRLMGIYKNDWKLILAKYYELQKPNCDAIADMAQADFLNVTTKADYPEFLMREQVEKVITHNFPNYYLPRNKMVSHTTIPYGICQKIGLVQDDILMELCRGLKKPEEVNLKQADELIHSKLLPLIRSL